LPNVPRYETRSFTREKTAVISANPKAKGSRGKFFQVHTHTRSILPSLKTNLQPEVGAEWQVTEQSTLGDSKNKYR